MFFLTLWLFWGLTVGHLRQAELLIIMAELCMETPRQQSAAKCTSFCPQSLFFLFTLTNRVCHLRRSFQTLWAHLKQKHVFGFRLKGLRLYHIISGDANHHTEQIFKHMQTCWPETSHSCHGCSLFIGQATIQGLKTMPSTPRNMSTLTRKPWWGWWRRWA